MLPMLGSVLIVEDGMLISLDLEDAFEDLGVRHIYAATSLSAALQKLDEHRPSFVTLDIDLGDGSSEALVPILRERGIAYIVISGQARASLPSVFEDAVCLSKPFTKDGLMGAIDSASANRNLAWAV